MSKSLTLAGAIALSALGLLVTGLPTEAHAREKDSLDQAIRAVVSILPEWPEDARRKEEPEASGVVWSDGVHIVTAYHVVAKARAIRIRTYDGLIMNARQIGRDPATDLAVLKVAEPLTPARLEKDALSIGERVCAVGNAFGLGVSVTCGVVSALNQAGVGFNPIEDFIQTDAAVNPGASGGALATPDGRIVGVLSAIFTKQSDANIGVNFAVSMQLTRMIVEELIAHGHVKRRSTGLRLSSNLRAATQSVGGGAPIRLGLRITHVAPGSPAERASLKVGDEIVSAAGRRVTKTAEFVGASALATPDKKLPLVVVRDGREQRLTIDLSDNQKK